MEQGKGCLNMIPKIEINVDLIRLKNSNSGMFTINTGNKYTGGIL